MSSQQQQQQVNSTTTASPWSAQSPYLTSGFSAAQNALNQAQSNTNVPTQFLAAFNPEQLSTFNQMVNSGQNLGIPQSEAALGSTLSGAGAGASTGALTSLGAFDPSATNNMNSVINAANQYASGINIPGQVAAAMQPAIETARDVTLPGMEATAAGTGNINSSRAGVNEGIVQRGLAEQAGNLAATLGNEAYTTGAGIGANQAQTNLGASLQSLISQGQLGGSLSTLGLGALSGSIGDTSNLLNLAGTGATGLQQAAQNPLDNAIQAYQFSQQAPFEALQNYWNIVGSGNWGGTSNTQGVTNTTTTPSMLSTIGGLLGAGASVGGANGLFGANGLLGGNGAFSTNGAFGSSGALSGVSGALSGALAGLF